MALKHHFHSSSRSSWYSYSLASAGFGRGGVCGVCRRASGFAEIIKEGVEGEVVAAPATWLRSGPEAIRRVREAIRPQLLALGARYMIEENARRTLALIAR